jgi:hypothetical protein
MTKIAMTRNCLLSLPLVCWCLSPFVCAQGVAGYPGVFDTSQVLHLNLTMDPQDFATIRIDQTFDIEVPAWFWADGEDPLQVVVRRKSADSINGKVSYKIDINKLVDGQKWNNLNKLSFENGDDQDVVSEGLAWHMHRAAAEGLASYSPSLAAWTTLTINGEHQGVYVNVEQVDKQFLRNRSLWVSGQSWLYFQDDRGQSEYKEGPTSVSPTMEALHFRPFATGGQLPPAPQGEALQTLLSDHINMHAMLTLGAVNAFTSNPDELFNHAKNFFWADFVPGSSLGNSNGKRMYFPWDLDSAIQSTSSSIYGQGSGATFKQEPYQELILNDPAFRHQYNMILLSLLNGPLSVANLTAFLDEIEPLLTPLLEADPNSKIGNAAAHFSGLRNWVSVRHANVHQQVLNDLGALPGDFNHDGVVDAADYIVWRKNNGTPDGYNMWRTSFSTASGSGPTSTDVIDSAVPEPSSFALLVMVAIGILIRKCRSTALG